MTVYVDMAREGKVGEPIFGIYDQEALDREYNNRAKIPNAAEQVEDWLTRGEEARGMLSCDLDVPYGSHPRQALDIFPAAKPGAPVMMFTHGGYWHSRDKSLIHFLAPTFVAADVTFVSLGYRLCPEVTVADVLADVRAGASWVAENIGGRGGDPTRLHLAGHSAGGHLTAMLAGPLGLPKGMLKRACSISGLHDLETIRLCYLTGELNLTEADVPGLSPIALAQGLASGGPALPPLTVTTGGAEGPEYLRQRDELVDALRSAGQPVRVVEQPGGDHFSACTALGDPNSELCQTVLRGIFAPGFPG